MAQCIAKRKRLPLIREIFVLSGDTHNAGTNFEKSCRYELRGLAKKCQLQLGQFLFYKSPPLKFEERSRDLTEADARSLQPESADEMIKVFVDDDPEPKSIVSLEDSMLYDLAQKRFQIYRLYLADPNAAEDTIKTAKSHVSKW